MRTTAIAPGLIPGLTDHDGTTAADEPGLAPDWSAVQTALDRTIDARAGYEAMLTRASDGFRPVVTRLLDLHDRHADALARILVDAGQVPGDGTLMSVVNRTVIAVRGAIAEIDHSAMDEIRDGERHVVEALEAAAMQPLPEPVRAEIAAMIVQIEALLSEPSRAD